MIDELIKNSRSIRRFRQGEPVKTSLIHKLVDLARLSSSAANLQPLKYIVVNTPEICAKIFPCLGWAGYLTDWDGPTEGERPPAYIIALLDTTIADKADIDLGIALQSMKLGATSGGLGSSVILNFTRATIIELLKIPDHLTPLAVLALGVPVEVVVLEQMEEGAVKYWRDEDGTHHVPKRSLDEIIVGKVR